MKNLVIVESPAKAKTIEGFLGEDFVVKSSFGHVRDLAKNKLSIDIEKGFIPHYEVSVDKKKIVDELRKLSNKADTVWLATDEDREGEAISWHLAQTLELNNKKIKRIVFHEITKTAILKAIKEPRTINQNLVDAQQARRVLDRLVGFELSPVLWKKVKPALSAGRVQSVAVRLIVEREKEIEKFKSTSSFKITALFDIMDKKTKYQLEAELPERFDTKAKAIAFLEKCKEAIFTVADIEVKPGKKSPAAPFTTSTLQQEASRKLGFSVARTMMVAQQLYESGKITYMRTDSVNLSEDALKMAKEEIIASYGKEYVHTRQYQTKTKGAQEAHEAIRPTYMAHHTVTGDDAQRRLYDLIWKRTIASQMSDAILERTNVNIDISKTKEKLIAKGEVIKFDGFLKVYLESTDDEDDDSKKGLLPPLTIGQKLDLFNILAVERFSQHAARYTEASLVKKLEELGIGRPSTYAPIISTIQKREYVVVEDRDGRERNYEWIELKNNTIKEETKKEKTGFEKSKFFPTDIGNLVTSFLVNYFDNVLDYNFTANVEKEFDEIAQGTIEWNKMIKEFYYPFHKQVEETLEKSEKVKGERLLGVDPTSGKNLYVKLGRFGPMAQIGETDDVDKPKFAGLLKGQSMETINLQQALELFRLPRVIGEYEGKEMVAAVGRFGPYIRHDGAFYSLPKTEDPLTVSINNSIEIIEQKRLKESQKQIHDFGEIKVLNGRYGPYITDGDNNYKIPKGTEPKDLTLNQCKEIIANSPEPKSKPKFKKASKAKVETKEVKKESKKATTTKAAKSSTTKKTTTTKKTKK